MSKKILLSLAALMLFSACTTSDKDVTLKEYNIAFDYPPTWEELKVQEPQKAAYLLNDDPTNEHDRSNVNLVIEDLKEEVDLEEFGKATSAEIEDKTEFTVTDTKTGTLIAGVPAVVFSFESKEDGPEAMQFVQYWFAKDAKQYLVTYTAYKDDFPKYIDQVEALVSSLEFIK